MSAAGNGAAVGRVGGQDLLQLRVRRDGAALVELVLLDVGPDGLHGLRAGHLVLAADRGEVGGQRLGGEEPNALLLLRRRQLLTGSLHNVRSIREEMRFILALTKPELNPLSWTLPRLLTKH